MEKQSEILEKLSVELQKPMPSAITIVELLLICAYHSHASDIHINPEKDALRVRMRVAGELVESISIPLSIYKEVITRIKILSCLRTDEHHIAQDGRFTLEHTDLPFIHIRVSIVPTYYGENIVLRLLVPQANLSTLYDLGFSSRHQTYILDSLTKPHGLILITGPTGSGKSSTLYTCVQILKSQSASVLTIEDPIEYTLDGVRQIQVQHANFTFKDGLRSVLRQDPDVLIIGEIRDAETASFALHAALTGHLVLSTLHTNSAEITIPRLLAMGIESYLISATLSLIVHQRLVPRLCVKCRKRVSIPKDQQIALATSITQEYLRPHSKYVSSGCVHCNQTGRNGRIAIAELIVCSPHASDQKSISVSDYQTFDPLWVDALQKTSTGLIPLDVCLSFLPQI